MKNLNIIIFRTDRVGDLIVTCPAIITIKNYFEDPSITIVTSEKTSTNNKLISSSLGQATIQKDETVENVEKKFRPFFFIAKKNN